MQYRPDIDGLRSVAVLSVIISHASPALLPGGFLGVDIFFVISGYLIASLVARDVEAGSFSGSTFYARRIRRLVPAFFVAMLATLVAGMFFMLPSELERTSLSVLSAVASVSNYFFALTSGYFAPDAALDPAMHTWSLAVEEQYYLVFPALLVLFYRRSRRAMFGLLAAIAIVSFVAAVRATDANSGFAYFALWTRAWELLAGAMLALGMPSLSNKLNPLIGHALAASSAIALGLCFALFDKTVAHPGYPTLIPVVATMGIIATGAAGTFISRLLSLRPFVFVGLISYSAYLWHQPIIAFYSTIIGEKSILVVITLVAASLLAGFISWALIERPARRLRISNGKTYIAFLLSVVILAGAASKIIATDGMPGRLPDSALRIASYETPETDIARNCNIDDAKDFSVDALCRHGDSTPKAVLWGDSHGLSIAAGLLTEEPNFAFVQAAVSGCKISIKHMNPRWKRGCAKTEKQIQEMIMGDASLETVIFAGRWSTSGDSFLDLTGARAVPGAVHAELSEIITRVADAGRKVIIVDPVPELSRSVPEAAARAEWLQGSQRQPVSITTQEFDERHHQVHESFATLENHPNVVRIKVRDLFCDDETGLCAGEKDGLPLYYDDDHLNGLGASPIARRVIDAVRDWPYTSDRASDIGE